jgi:hypothetical protein
MYAIWALLLAINLASLTYFHKSKSRGGCPRLDFQPGSWGWVFYLAWALTTSQKRIAAIFRRL